jgi:two-component system response regulator HydG
MNHKNPVILVVDDDPEDRAAIVKVLQHAGYSAREADNGEEGIHRIMDGGIDILISGLRLPQRGGVELLKIVKSVECDTEVILITGHGTVEAAVEALKEGASDFISKPVKRAALLRAVDIAAEKQWLARANRQLRSQLSANGARRFVYASSEMRRIVRMAGQVAPSSATILITGESGSGKEVIADAIHAGSSRLDRPFVKVRCAALPETLLEAELFGCEKSTFAGGPARKQGWFELANGGTLFLDEISESSPIVQVKLLRVLEHGKFERLGGSKAIDTDVRILAATNQDLHKEVDAGRFRKDLFCRLNAINIHVPPLRERKDDIHILALHFLRTYAEKNTKSIEGFSAAAMFALRSYDWPGNVRELESVIERSVVLTNGKLIRENHLPHGVSEPAESRHSLNFKIGTPLHEIERQVVEIALQHTRGDKNVAARLLGIAPRTIYRHFERQERERQAAQQKMAG